MKKRSILSLMSVIPAMFRGLKTDINGEKVPIKARYVPGDHFYKNLSWKRVNGKWRVKR